jgi:hypothetical protein
MFTGKIAKVYGEEMPVQRYNLHWSCGCITKGVELASHSPIADDVHMAHDCPSCYTGPFANVWD